MSAVVDAAEPPARRSEQKAWRSEQLLDAASRVLMTKGRSGFTMEAVASEAGVSKALPYRHFANSDEVLVGLARREIGLVLNCLSTAADAEPENDEAVRAVIHEYFRLVAERGPLLAVLAGTGSDIPDLPGSGLRQPPPFLVEMLVRRFAIPLGIASVLSHMVTATVIAGSDRVGWGGTDPRTAEAVEIGRAHV